MATDGQGEDVVPVLIPVEKPLSPIPVGLKEAALDSPTFRATAVHFSDQVEAVERWLDGLIRSASKFTQEISVFEGLINSYLASSAPPTNLSEAALDHDYTVLALQRYHDSVRDYWNTFLAGQKKAQTTLVEPVKNFMSADLRPFKDARRQLDNTQKYYDSILSRYASQGKTKEASSLREDAFQLHEARKGYLKASMDFCVLAPQFRLALDTLLISVFSSQWSEMKVLRDASTTIFGKHGMEMERVQCWSQEMSQGEKALKRELLMARRKIEEKAELAARPSRELDYYATSTVPNLGAGPSGIPVDTSSDATNSSKQGWLFLRTVTGKPARTNWIRRWFFVKNGIFGWLVPSSRSGGVEESEKIGVLLCNIRPAFQEERRFCFEVKTKDTTLLLQTETQSDLTDWIAVFEKAKRQALEEPTTTELLANSGGNPSFDAAFAVNPPISPEFAAKRSDGQVTNISEEISGSHLTVDGDGPSGLAARGGSFDVSTQGRPVDKDSDRNRDHAARIIQKLDLHRKSTAGAQTTAGGFAPAPVPSGGGIASLISASTSAIPLARTPTLPPAELRQGLLSAAASNSLAPSTLVNPPAPTNLSKTAVALGMEKGLDLGVVDWTGGMPSSMMANHWGSMNYGHLSRIDRGEVKHSRVTSLTQPLDATERRSSDPPATPDFQSTADASPPKALQRSTSTSTVPSPRPSPSHKPLSVLQEPLVPQIKKSGSAAHFPSSYPIALRAHDAQFRLIFPNMHTSERVVLVFRGSWNPEANQDLPGRIFVTVSGMMYFYGHHFGLVTVSSADLSRVTEITASSGNSHDTLQLHLKGQNGREEMSVITIKTFLEPLRLLRRRLDYLVANSRAEEPDDLEDVIKTLGRITAGERGRRPSVDSLDDFALPPSEEPMRGGERNSHLNVDRRFYGGDSAGFYEPDEVVRFKLPAQPVQYTPHAVPNLAVERLFEVSAKALYHIIFGDRSAICQILYRQRRAESVKQYPWTRTENAHFQRQFEYEVQDIGRFGRSTTTNIIDKQTIDVASDHLCYVVTDTKTPWHLPYREDFSLVSKIVITHYAKSKSKLAIFTRIAWHSKPRFSSHLVERRATDELYVDALDMIDLVTDQVQRLGPNCYTKRALQIFGPIGQQTEAAQITSADPSILLDRPLPVMVKRTSIFGLVYEDVLSIGTSCLSTVIMSIIGLCRALFKMLSMHSILSILLLVTVSLQLFSTSEFILNWQRDFKASSFMSRVGVGPDTIMSRAVYLKDIRELAFDIQVEDYSHNKCSNAFATVLGRIDVDSPSPQNGARSSTAMTSRLLQRTRQRMSMYRHDLMVAMRLVNNVERDTVRAMYENWLIEENIRCGQMQSLLQRNDTQGLEFSDRLAQAEGSGEQGWWRQYCESCAQEEADMLASAETHGNGVGVLAGRGWPWLVLPPPGGWAFVVLHYHPASPIPNPLLLASESAAVPERARNSLSSLSAPQISSATV